MTTITAGMVKDLRERTGAGMMDCKTALTETKGDMEAAIDWLRTKGITKAAKKSDRVAAQGLIGAMSTGKTGALVEVNSETDFVARNDQFQDMVQKITSLAPAAKGDLAKLLASKYPGTSNTVETQVKDAIATIGENMGVRRTAALSVKDGIEFPFPEYLRKLTNEILRRWQRPAGTGALEAEVSFTIARDGTVREIKVVRSSRSYGFDLEAQGAVEQAGEEKAFGPLPKGWNSDILQVAFLFTPRKRP